jgi:acyl dehydratase
MGTYRPTAINHAHESENRIHADNIAQRYGFRGGLVPGVAVFGYMTHPITEALGSQWLGHASVDVRFLKPAYDGERLAIDLIQAIPNARVECKNDAGVLLATLKLDASAPPPVDPRAHVPAASRNPERIEINWDAISVDQPFAALQWLPTELENRTYAEYVADQSPAYRDGLVHPHLILHWANQVLVRRFVLPAWVHVGSEIRFRRLLCVGDAIELRTIPIEKWRHKGHEFIKLYIAYLVGDEAAVEVYHTAIFKLAQKAA